MNVHSNFIQKRQSTKTSDKTISCSSVDKQGVVYPYNGRVFVNTKE